MAGRAHGVAPEKGAADSLTSALEAQAIAADIARLRAEGVIEGWGEVAVLLRVTTAQEVLLEAFREAGIPYEVARERDYYRQREVVELAALVRCVLEPADVLALLTVVRSDVVGVPDAALAPLWEAGFPGAAWPGWRVGGSGGGWQPSIRESIGQGAWLRCRPNAARRRARCPRWPAALQGAVGDSSPRSRRCAAGGCTPDVFVDPRSIAARRR